MFKYLAEILNSFSPAQRILALLILVSTITTITLGPTLIKENTKDCTELELRLASQSRQIKELTSRIETLNRELIAGQQLCTNNLIQKQQQIMGLIDGMIQETQTGAKSLARPVKVKDTHVNGGQDPNEPVVMMLIRPEAEPDNRKEIESYQKTLKKLKSLKIQVNQTLSPGRP